MAKSIIVYRYSYPLSLGQVRQSLGSHQRIPNEQPDKNNPDELIEVPSTISDIKSHAFGITGYIKYGFQKKNEFVENERYDLTFIEYNFLISPTSKIMILHGPPEYRIRVRDLLSTILHGTDGGLFSSITIKKELLKDLVDKIIRMNSDNILEEGKFKYYGRPFKDLKKISFATIPEVCITRHAYFLPHYNKCSEWACGLRIHKCNGIMDVFSETSQRLNINLDASFSLTMDTDLKEWNRFIVETCKEALEL